MVGCLTVQLKLSIKVLEKPVSERLYSLINKVVSVSRWPLSKVFTLDLCCVVGLCNFYKSYMGNGTHNCSFMAKNFLGCTLGSFGHLGHLSSLMGNVTTLIADRY